MPSAFICIRALRRSFARNTNAVTLTTPGGQIWRFLAEGAELDVEESIFFADPICLRRSLADRAQRAMHEGDFGPMEIREGGAAAAPVSFGGDQVRRFSRS